VTSGRLIRNLALIGLMGAGKTTVGRMCAARLGFEFLDTDAEIQQRAGKSVAAIFEQDGEARFREMERALVAELAGRERLVIATGGGLAANPENLASLKTHALTVYLCASAEKLYGRVRHATHRPLLQHPDPLGRLKELLAQREPVYRGADVLLSTEWRSPVESVAHVVAEFRAATTASAASA
jgi:shikimate kinase